MQRTKRNTFGSLTTLTVLSSLPLAYAVTAAGSEGVTNISEMVAYAVNEDTSSLIRYTFSDDAFQTVGPLELDDGTILTDVESLASVKSSLHLYGVSNNNEADTSQLVRINLMTGKATLLANETGFGNVEGMTAVENLNRGPGPESPTSVILHDSQGREAFLVTFVEVTFNDDGTSSWTYEVQELEDGRDLSHWTLGLAECHTVMPGTTEGYDLGIDGSSGFYGIKWDVPDGFSIGEFTIVLDKHYGGTEGGTGIGVLAKGGNTPDTSEIFGPTCNVPPEFVLYGVNFDQEGTRSLISIDPQTGVGNAEMTLSQNYEGLAAGADGTLYGIADRDLWRLDPFSDSETHLGTSDFVDIDALEYAFGDESAAVEIPGVDPAFWADGILFGFSDVDDTLMLIDPATGAAQSYPSALAGSDLEGFTFVTIAADPAPKILSAVFD